ncbi:hypothetical protein SAMN05518672_113148 [Chitinophaga sp. CF118]|uniref:hypothetical protein n=1 Tax=Chitinophaga sp. CF118 TaxID=1884367 RepID=UPI0008F3BCAD|nr:hypothetical protein [Chitinophaga sp. CF118]SFE98297.1 hypothetical protein SAMN05518672_113148 [Chitinophaga sp. CF118]
MKNIAVVVMCFLYACNSKPIEDCNIPYSIDIWNLNASMAYSISYQVNNDSLIVSFIDVVKGTSNKVHAKALTQTERNRFCNYLTSFNIDTLKEQYINPSVDDGNQEIVILKLENKKKKIEISNIHQENIAGLFKIVNDVMGDEKYKIKYQ